MIYLRATSKAPVCMISSSTRSWISSTFMAWPRDRQLGCTWSLISMICSLVKRWLSGTTWLALVMAAIIFVTANLFYGIRKHRSMYTAYLVVYLILNTSFDWVISVPRYMTCAIPAFLFLSDFSERHKWTEPIITASMAIGLGIYLTGYLCWKQIL